ncbi:MAG TPA: M28 family peptidase, partial [bacterium]|nr:M28 family peptidase [bacterium]
MDATQVAGRCLSPQYGFCMQDADSGSDRADVPLAFERNSTSESTWPSPSSFFLSDIFWLHSGRNASSFPSSLVKSEDVLAHIREISDDRYEGRDSPSRGLDLAADYIRGVAEMYGLRGAGPDSSFYQSFSIYGFSPHGAHKSSSAAGGKGRAPDSYGTKLFEYAVHEDELEVRKSRTPAAKVSFFKWGKANNVVGMLEGSDSKLKDEYIIVSAHYDHIGTRSRGEDRIYNGADDNASGSAVLMGILPALKEMAKRGMGPKRSVIFIWTAAEEKGLLGADYYRRHPLRPISKTKAAINVDMVARLSADRISVCDIDRKGKPSF